MTVASFPVRQCDGRLFELLGSDVGGRDFVVPDARKLNAKGNKAGVVRVERSYTFILAH